MDEQYLQSFGTLRPDFMLKLVHGLAFGTHKFYIAPYGNINHRLINLRYNYDMKLGLSVSCKLILKYMLSSFLLEVVGK